MTYTAVRNTVKFITLQLYDDLCTRFLQTLRLNRTFQCEQHCCPWILLFLKQRLHRASFFIVSFCSCIPHCKKCRSYKWKIHSPLPLTVLMVVSWKSRDMECASSVFDAAERMEIAAETLYTKFSERWILMTIDWNTHCFIRAIDKIHCQFDMKAVQSGQKAMQQNSF